MTGRVVIVVNFFAADVHSQLTSSVEGSSQQVLTGRMRKRDIVRYYGKRMIRKVYNAIGVLTTPMP